MKYWKERPRVKTEIFELEQVAEQYDSLLKNVTRRVVVLRWNRVRG